jgi:hypothetical protein
MCDKLRSGNPPGNTVYRLARRWNCYKVVRGLFRVRYVVLPSDAPLPWFGLRVPEIPEGHSLVREPGEAYYRLQSRH